MPYQKIIKLTLSFLVKNWPFPVNSDSLKNGRSPKDTTKGPTHILTRVKLNALSQSIIVVKIRPDRPVKLGTSPSLGSDKPPKPCWHRTGLGTGELAVSRFGAIKKLGSIILFFLKNPRRHCFSLIFFLPKRYKPEKHYGEMRER